MRGVLPMNKNLHKKVQSKSYNMPWERLVLRHIIGVKPSTVKWSKQYLNRTYRRKNKQQKIDNE